MRSVKSDQAHEAEKGEGLVEVKTMMDSPTPQLWRFLREPVVLTEIIGRVFPQGEWGEDRLGLLHAKWAAPKAGSQVCDGCGRSGFRTFRDAWDHKVLCLPQD